MPTPRYRFSEFTLSPARRLLLRAGREVPLIPRYFDLLLLLVEKRGEAVSRREIFDRVWSDVVVSDGALSQAVRTLRRALGDDVKEPRFIRTMSRHGYRFVHPEVIEEPDGGVDTSALAAQPEAAAPVPPSATANPRIGSAPAAKPDPIEPLLERLLRSSATGSVVTEDAREAAEALHALDTGETLRRLDARPGRPRARALALLRETRWDVPGAGPVPLLGRPDGIGAALILIRIRLRAAARLASSRWASASAGGAVAGALAGAAGGLLLRRVTGDDAPASLPVALAMVGAAIGGLGAAGVGAGLAAAEALARSWRGPMLVILGALGGGGVGAAAHILGGRTLEDLFGGSLSAVGGGLEGLALGAAAGLGYALSTPRPGGGGMATPRGSPRLTAALVTGLSCATAGLLLALAGRNLGAGSLDLMSRSFEGSRVSLEPLARLLGEDQVGAVTRGVLSSYEGLLFGAGLALGLTRRPVSSGTGSKSE